MSCDGGSKKEAEEQQLPVDLTVAILWRLPAKYVVRLCFLSKMWSSLITTPYYMNSPCNRPCLLVTVKERSNYFVTGLSQYKSGPPKSFESYRTVLDWEFKICSLFTRGLVCLKNPKHQLGVWNPTTRQFLILPKPQSSWWFPIILVGYDPIEDKYKVLCVASSTCLLKGTKVEVEGEVLTLGEGDDHQLSWRLVAAGNCPAHLCRCVGPCINGVIYYKANLCGGKDEDVKYEDIKKVIMSFDVRFEKFKIIEEPTSCRFGYLANYHGRLAWVCVDGSPSFDLWILEDNGEWSFTRPFLPFHLLDPVWKLPLRFKGVTDFTGELVFVVDPVPTRFNAFYVLYYDPKTNYAREVRFEGAAYDKITRGGKEVDDIHFSPNYMDNFMSLN